MLPTCSLTGSILQAVTYDMVAFVLPKSHEALSISAAFASKDGAFV